MSNEIYWILSPRPYFYCLQSHTKNVIIYTCEGIFYAKAHISGRFAYNKRQEIFMTFRINTNSVKNAMGTMFLLAAAFFVCSTLVSMRSVFADPIVNSNNLPQRLGRTSPRANATTSNRSTVSRATTSRTTASRSTNSNNATRTTVSRGTGANRTVSSRTTPTRTTATSTRGVVSRNNAATNRTTNNRAVRARTSNTPSRVSATGSVMAGTRASTSTSYTYLSSKLYTGSYANIIDSTTGLISADAYSNCMESYYTCMDEICTARSDTKGRCSCAGRATNFLVAEEQLEKANEELIKLSGQLSLLVATKGKGDDLSYAFSLTEAEQVMNCVSWKDAWNTAGSTKDDEGNTISRDTYLKNWCKEHSLYDYTSDNCSFSVSANGPSYCTTTGTGGNTFGFDIKNIDGSSSDILAQLKAWANAKDLAKEYTISNEDNISKNYKTVSGVVNALTGITDTDSDDTAHLDALANRWGYDLFQYAHNNVCGRVLDSCFNGIFEACGTPPTVKESEKTTHVKCANGATSNCPFNYNSYVSVNSDTGDVELNERGSGSANATSSASCFGYTVTSTTTGTRTTATSSSDPYYTLRGPVADARRSIMQKYLLDANAACDTYGAALKQTAQNINYQKIAAEQALQQKRLEFRQEEQAQTLADATAAIDNFNECISEIWDCYDEYSDEDQKWTTARIKAYCSQVSQVPHCYETMICAPLQSQLTAVIDLPDDNKCTYSTDYTQNTCRNVVTISEILYGTGVSPLAGALNEQLNGNASVDNLQSAAVREACLQKALNCNDTNAAEDACLRDWDKDWYKSSTNSGN